MAVGQVHSPQDEIVTFDIGAVYRTDVYEIHTSSGTSLRRTYIITSDGEVPGSIDIRLVDLEVSDDGTETKVRDYTLSAPDIEKAFKTFWAELGDSRGRNPRLLEAVEMRNSDRAHKPEQPEPLVIDQEPSQKDKANQPTQDQNKTPVESKPEIEPSDRAATTEPKRNHRPDHITTASDIADAFDDQRDQAKRAIAVWRNQLDEMVQDSGSLWSVLGATAAATALSVTEFSMDQASGLLGLTRLGQGVAKGSFSGVMEDVDRLVSVLPQGRAVKALSIATDVYAIGNTVASGGDLSTVAVTAGGMLMGAKSKKQSGKRWKRGSKRKKTIKVRGSSNEKLSRVRVQTARILSKATRAKYLKRVQELHKALDLRGQGGKTTAILIARDPKTGSLKTLVSSSMERVPKKVRDKMKRNEIEVRGTKKSKNSSPNDHSHHAEVNGLSAILSMGWEVVEVFPSRNACPLCAQMRKSLGVRITDPKSI